uniref:Uncharacterized protein n=1 Tax=Leersia perrieri TaxID=77586 RepID=A0A0D9XBU7_9ORYZ
MGHGNADPVEESEVGMLVGAPSKRVQVVEVFALVLMLRVSMLYDRAHIAASLRHHDVGGSGGGGRDGTRAAVYSTKLRRLLRAFPTITWGRIGGGHGRSGHRSSTGAAGVARGFHPAVSAGVGEG